MFLTYTGRGKAVFGYYHNQGVPKKQQKRFHYFFLLRTQSVIVIHKVLL